MVRRFVGVLAVLVAGAWLGACGDDSSLRGYSQPLRVVERTVFYLESLRDRHLLREDYQISNDPSISGARDTIRITFPSAIRKHVRDAAVREQVLAKLQQLDDVFEQRVWLPASRSPADRQEASDGCDQCLRIVGEVKQLLGG